MPKIQQISPVEKGLLIHNRPVEKKTLVFLTFSGFST